MRLWLTTSLGLSLLWGLNLCLLLGSVFWIALDPIVSRHIAFEENRLAIAEAMGRTSLAEPIAQESGRSRALAAIGLLAVGGAAALALSLVFGARQHRQLRSWLAFTALIAGWLGLAVAWRDVAWAGQRWRISQQVAGVEPLAAALRAEWPRDDGSRVPGLGPYMAYPPGNPRMLLLLHQVRPKGSSNTISAVERSDAGGLRFELADGDAGAWLEWHPAGQRPASFVGGLEGAYELVRFSKLGDGWYLVRYRPTADGKVQEFH